MNKRIVRILNGEELGPMIDSEFEDLQIDDEFELLRDRQENDKYDVVEGKTDSDFEKEYLIPTPRTPESEAFSDGYDQESEEPPEENIRLPIGSRPMSVQPFRPFGR